MAMTTKQLTRAETLHHCIELFFIEYGDSIGDTALENLYAIPPRNWSVSQEDKAYDYLGQYKRQLNNLGIVLDDLAPEATKDTPPPKPCRVNVINDQLVVLLPPEHHFLVMQLQSIPYYTYLHESRDGIPAPACVFPITAETVTEVSDLIKEQKAKGVEFVGDSAAHKLIQAARSGSLKLNGNIIHDAKEYVGYIDVDKGSTLYAIFPNQERLKREIGAVPGKKWANGRFEFPMIGPAARKLEEFSQNERFRVTPQAQKTIEYAQELGRLNLEDSDGINPRGEVIVDTAKDLWDYQKLGVEWLVRNKRTFLGDKMGTGKTIMALGAIEYQKAYPAIVVCPSSVKYNWAKEIVAWLPHRTVQVLEGRSDTVEGADITILNYDIIIDVMQRLSITLPANREVVNTAIAELRKYKKKVKVDDDALVAIEIAKTYGGVASGDQAEMLTADQLENIDLLLSLRNPRGKIDLDDNGDFVFSIAHDVPNKYLADMRNMRPEAIVFDESHRLNNGHSKRSRNCHDLVAGHERYQKGTQWVRKSNQYQVPIVYMASGTQVKRRPSELIHPLKILDRLQWFGGWTTFTDRYCARHATAFSANDISGATNLEELNQHLREMGLMLRRPKEKVLPFLPERTWVPLPVKLSNENKYAKVARDTSTWFAERAVEKKEFLDSIAHLMDWEKEKAIREHKQTKRAKAERAKGLTKISALRQVSAEGKIAAAKTWVEDALSENEKVIVFFIHTKVGQAIMKVKEFKAMLIDGSVPTKGGHRQQIVDKFQEDPESRVLCVQMVAGGEGITLTASRYGLFVESHWTYPDMEQAIDRMHRPGQERHVFGYVMAGMNTIDEYMLKLIDVSEIGSGTILDGDHDQMDMQKELYKMFMKNGAY